MGTRSITHIHEAAIDDNRDWSTEKIICTFYRHWDGYPSGHGTDLLKFCESKGRVTNGKGADFVEDYDYNGMGEFAVKLMNYIFDESGCEVIETGHNGMWEDYTYHVFYRQSHAFTGFLVVCDPSNAAEFRLDNELEWLTYAQREKLEEEETDWNDPRRNIPFYLDPEILLEGEE